MKAKESDYSNGFEDGYQLRSGQMDLLAEELEKALAIVKAYAEDEGYTPSRVMDKVKFLEQAGLL